MLFVWEAQAEVMGLKYELSAAAELSRKHAEQVHQMSAELSDETQRALGAEEEGTCFT